MNDTSSPAVVPAGVSATSAGTITGFDGETTPLLRLCLKNALLNLLTLFFYRFWAKTHLRRYFWGHTRIGDDYLEYTGTAGELVKGFLVAIVAFTVLSFAFTLVSGIVQAVGLMPVAVVLQLLFGLLVWSLWYVALHRAWRYRLSRTRFRGVAMRLAGETKTFVVVSWKYTLLLIVTFGVALPYQSVATARLTLGQAVLGTTSFTLEATGRALVGVWLRHLLIALGAVVATGVVAAGMPVAGIVVGLVAVAVVVASFIAYRVAELRYIVGQLSFGEARFSSQMSDTTTVRILVTYVLGLLLASAAVVVPVGVVLSLLIAGRGGNIGEFAEVAGSTGPIAIGLIIIAIVFVVLPTLKTLLLDLPLARHFLATLKISHPEAFDQAVQDPAVQAPRRGEGLADLFGVDGV